MRLILVDRSEEIRRNFYPIALSRPLWELRCGISSLGEKLIAKTDTGDVAYFVPDYMAEAYRAKVMHPVNDLSVLKGDDVLIVDPLVKAQDFNISTGGKSEVGIDQDGRTLYARIIKRDLDGISVNDVVGLLEAARRKFPNVP